MHFIKQMPFNKLNQSILMKKGTIKITPIPDYMMIKRVHSYHGTTLFATKHIPKGHVLCTTVLTNIDYHEGCIISPIGDVFVHSDKPNAQIRINTKISDFPIVFVDIFALDDISAGEEITTKYENNKHKSLTRSELIDQINFQNGIF